MFYRSSNVKYTCLKITHTLVDEAKPFFARKKENIHHRFAGAKIEKKATCKLFFYPLSSSTSHQAPNYVKRS